jgi:hypothetical protein
VVCWCGGFPRKGCAYSCRQVPKTTLLGFSRFILRTQEFDGKVMAYIDNATDAKEQAEGRARVLTPVGH